MGVVKVASILAPRAESRDAVGVPGPPAVRIELERRKRRGTFLPSPNLAVLGAVRAARRAHDESSASLANGGSLTTTHPSSVQAGGKGHLDEHRRGGDNAIRVEPCVARGALGEVVASARGTGRFDTIVATALVCFAIVAARMEPRLARTWGAHVGVVSGACHSGLLATIAAAARICLAGVATLVEPRVAHVATLDEVVASARSTGRSVAVCAGAHVRLARSAGDASGPVEARVAGSALDEVVAAAGRARSGPAIGTRARVCRARITRLVKTGFAYVAHVRVMGPARGERGSRAKRDTTAAARADVDRARRRRTHQAGRGSLA